MGILDRLHKKQPGVKLRPNDPCPCGSGRPVKECCAQLLEP
ncbi:MAG: SEC-C domain-containing protein [Halobacteriales archaeon]|nr:SEC-C domain-containing protein [Halobacteriales archaeon]